MALTLGTASVAPGSSEEDLIAATRDGDERAFEVLYARYADRIAGFIRSRVADHGRAEDVAQEVFISALRRLRASEQRIVFKPWIYEIAKNACIDEHRRHQRSREVSLDADSELASDRRPLYSVAPTPPAALENKEQLNDLRGAFGGLSENHHRLLVMREFEGLSYDEIGARTGMSRQMVESALFRARRKLGEEYEELASGRRCQQVQSAIQSGRVRRPRTLGLRERRQLSRHLAHCQLCRMQARLAGADDSLTFPRRVGAKIAALLPFPLWRWWPGAGAARQAAIRTGSHPVTTQSAQAVAAASPGLSAAVGGAAIAVAALALAGSGGGVAAPMHHLRTRAGARHAAPAPAAAPDAADGGLGAAGRTPAAPPAAGGSFAARHVRVVAVHIPLAPRGAGAPAPSPRRSPGARHAGLLPAAPAAPAVHAPVHLPAPTLSAATSAPAHEVARTVTRVRQVEHAVGGSLSKVASGHPAAPSALPPVPAAVTGAAHRLGGAVSGVSGLTGH